MYVCRYVVSSSCSPFRVCPWQSFAPGDTARSCNETLGEGELPSPPRSLSPTLFLCSFVNETVNLAREITSSEKRGTVGRELSGPRGQRAAFPTFFLLLQPFFLLASGPTTEHTTEEEECLLVFNREGVKEKLRNWALSLSSNARQKKNEEQFFERADAFSPVKEKSGAHLVLWGTQQEANTQI